MNGTDRRMKRLTVTYDTCDVDVVPFPFTDCSVSKRRPALVLSDNEVFNEAIGHSVLAMITTRGNSHWPLDIPIENLKAAGLPAPSIVRMKLFTLDHKIILRRAGRLAMEDQQNVRVALAHLLRFATPDQPTL